MFLILLAYLLTDIAEVMVGSPVEISDHSAVLIDVVLEQPIPYMLCRQEVHLRTL